tara:strand:+ start:81 stop:467 length:387 start_codon:yes stop_codon:yes gene_type:complete
MKIIDHNFVPEKLVTQILESYGYAREEVIEESVSETEPETAVEATEATEGSNCVYEHATGVYFLNPEVETINDNLYISVTEVSEENQVDLAESEVPSLTSIDFEEASYDLGEIFDTPEGKSFVHLKLS